MTTPARHADVTAAQIFAAFDRFPIRPVAAVLEPGPVLVVAPHPDDESLGCGGLIAAACQAGSPPYVAILTDGAGSHPNSRRYPPDRLREVRAQEARNAVAELGLSPDRVSFFNLPDTRSPRDGPAFDEAASALVTLVRRQAIATILAPWRHDPHGDHLSAHFLTAHAARLARCQHTSYPVWGLTLPPGTPLSGPLPTGFRLDITAQRDSKRRAIAAHRSQYSGLIDDDPAGFQLSADFVGLFERGFEVFIDNQPSDIDQSA